MLQSMVGPQGCHLFLSSPLPPSCVTHTPSCVNYEAWWAALYPAGSQSRMTGHEQTQGSLAAGTQMPSPEAVSSLRNALSFAVFP